VGWPKDSRRDGDSHTFARIKPGRVDTLAEFVITTRLNLVTFDDVECDPEPTEKNSWNSLHRTDGRPNAF
jgi:hypothetical protein